MANASLGKRDPHGTAVRETREGRSEVEITIEKAGKDDVRCPAIIAAIKIYAKTSVDKTVTGTVRLDKHLQRRRDIKEALPYISGCW